MATQFQILVHQDHLGAEFGGRQGSRHTGRATPHHRHVGVAILLIVIGLLEAFGVRVNRTQTGGATQHAFVNGPHEAWSNKGLVVEANGQEAIQLIVYGQ